VDGLLKQGLLAKNPLIDSVAAISVGMVGGQPVLDLDYPEDSGCDADMNIVMTGAGRYVEVQGTAEGHTFDRTELNNLLALAEDGIALLAQKQKSARLG
jgi:ribonuclease PH